MQPFIVSISQPRKVIISINIGEILTNYFKITNNPNIATWNIPNSTIIFYIAWFFINFIRNFIRAIEKSLVIQQFICQTKVGFIYVLNTDTPPLTRFFGTLGWKVRGWKVHGWKVWGWNVQGWIVHGWKVQGWNFQLGLKVWLLTSKRLFCNLIRHCCQPTNIFLFWSNLKFFFKYNFFQILVHVDIQRTPIPLGGQAWTFCWPPFKLTFSSRSNWTGISTGNSNSS